MHKRASFEELPAQVDRSKNLENIDHDTGLHLDIQTLILAQSL